MILDDNEAQERSIFKEKEMNLIHEQYEINRYGL
jgi:hypothetical protein